MAFASAPSQTGTIVTVSDDGKASKSFFTTANPFEQQFGYHRAVRRGQFIFVSGTTALKDANSPGDKNETTVEAAGDSKVHHPTDAQLQARIAMERCVDAVERLGGSREDIVRVKMFVSRHEHCGDVGAAYKECFAPSESHDAAAIGATATMIVVQDGFVDPDILVEVEVDAMLLGT